MNRWLLSLHRSLRALLPALVVALPPLFWVVDGTQKASLSALGRDQGIFQYVAWAIAHGARDYRDVRDVNGPLTHLVHLVFLKLGGADEHRFRVLDLTVTGLTFALAGACLPGIGRRTRVRPIERLGWALAGWVVLSGQYLMYIFWDLAQRESFFDWFLLPGVGLQLVAQRALASDEPRDRARGAALLAIAGALVAVPVFGKPTYAVFLVAQALTLAIDRRARATIARRFAFFGAGALGGALTQIAFLLVYGDLGAFLRIYLVDVPVMYRFIWPRTVAEILSMQGSVTAGLALVTSVVMLGLIWERLLPARALGVALLPLGGLASVIAQAKGFPYHFHPVTAGLALEWLLLVVWLWERFRAAPRGRVLARVVPVIAASALALRVAAEMPASPHVQALFVVDKGKYPEERESRDYLVYFQTSDFFPWEMREAARYLREHTRPEDRVQTYGMDPYVLFLAQRLSATPYIYAYDLDADAALAGGMLRDGLHPNGAEQARIRALRDAHEADLLARMKAAPPAAFVFLDKSPLIAWPDAWRDFVEHCPDASAWVKDHYKQTAVYGDDRVWLRRDLAEGLAEVRPQDARERGDAPPSPP